MGLVVFSQVLPIKNLTARLCHKLPRKPQNIDLLHGRFYYLFIIKMKKEEIKEIRSRAYAHGCQKEGVFIALNGLKREEITAEEKAKATDQLVELKREKRKQYRNGKDFRLCAM